MPVRFQLVIDCRDPELLARFWAAALGYVLEPPPEGFATWNDWRRDTGLGDSDLGTGADSIIDPRGDGPRIWFRAESDAKVVKNRLHLDGHASGGRSTVDREGPLAVRKAVCSARYGASPCCAVIVREFRRWRIDPARFRNHR